jgi:hypothetical protein
VFADVPAGWKERWRLIREFAERWYQIPMDDVGGPLKPLPRKSALSRDAQLRTVDDAMNDPKVSAGLPPALREWVVFIRDMQLGRDRFNLGDPGQHYLSAEWQRSALVQRDRPASGEVGFLLQYGGREGCFVRAGKREGPDPPVWWRDHTGPIWGRDSTRVVAPHVTTLALHYLLMQYEPEFGDHPGQQKMTKKFARQLANCFPVRGDFDGTQLFERDNAIALWAPESPFDGCSPCLHVKVRPPADQDEVLSQLFELE